MDENQRRLDNIRRGRSELDNSFIDEFAAGRLSRREFVRRGAVVGLSMPLMTAIIAAPTTPAARLPPAARAPARPAATSRSASWCRRPRSTL
jgi:peptide/nickel transport system substrate-binding protein